MKRFALVLTLLLAAESAFGVDLTPRYIDTFIDGITNRRLYFADGEKKIGVRVDRETRVEQIGGGVGFRFEKFPDVMFQIKTSPLTPDQPFSGIPLERYREAARRMVPPGAKGTQVVEEAEDPLPINQWKSYRITLACDLTDVPSRLVVTFLNLDEDQQLVLLTKSSERSFAEATQRSWQIIRTWQEFLPGDERPSGSN